MLPHRGTDQYLVKEINITHSKNSLKTCRHYFQPRWIIKSVVVNLFFETPWLTPWLCGRCFFLGFANRFSTKTGKTLWALHQAMTKCVAPKKTFNHLDVFYFILFLTNHLKRRKLILNRSDILIISKPFCCCLLFVCLFVCLFFL